MENFEDSLKSRVQFYLLDRRVSCLRVNRGGAKSDFFSPPPLFAHLLWAQFRSTPLGPFCFQPRVHENTESELRSGKKVPV